MTYKQMISRIRWAIRIVEDYRGCQVGNPDPRPLAKYDRKLKDLKEAVRILNFKI